MPVTTRKKVPTASRDVRKGAASGGTSGKKNTLTSTPRTVLPEPVEAEDLDFQRMADYYREGRYNLESGILERFPKEITPMVNREASIRVFGTGTGSDVQYEKGQRKERDFIPPYTKFILQSVQEAHQEKSQIVETFGDFYVFFYGERPPVYQFSGVLLNTENLNWASEFNYYYENYMRGTKCVETNSRII